MLSIIFHHLSSIALTEFPHIVTKTEILYTHAGTPRKLRIHLLDTSFIDVWLSLSGDYSYHWERTSIDGTIFRHDNAPHKSWRHIATFPKHFHNGSQYSVEESHISNQPETAVREFLRFVATKI